MKGTWSVEPGLSGHAVMIFMVSGNPRGRVTTVSVSPHGGPDRFLGAVLGPDGWRSVGSFRTRAEALRTVEGALGAVSCLEG